MARKRRRWVEAAAEIAHYLTGMSHRDYQHGVNEWLATFAGAATVSYEGWKCQELKGFATEDPRPQDKGQAGVTQLRISPCKLDTIESS
ncbi:hypothetical protein ACH79_32750 [Bradyrhizobium sp. CCBAU 051011]|nr:hypothetical protein ACH79_32750 [Bradyrhizobium sp. CCBAU 051011]